MIRALFKPFFKRFIGLFISMSFVSLLSIALLCTFGSSISNLRNTYKTYLYQYGYVDGIVKTNFYSREKLMSVQDVKGVDIADVRFTMDAYFKKSNGRVITSRIFSFNEYENIVFSRYVLKTAPMVEDSINISVTRKFANNNNLNPGDYVEIGYFNMFIKCHINEIVETTEGIYPRVNDYIWSDNQDFGYVYVSEIELNRGIYLLAKKVVDEIDNNPTYKAYYDKVAAVTGVTIPDLRKIIEENQIDFATKFGNQILFKNLNGYDQQEVLDRVKEYLENLDDRFVKVESATIGDNLPYRLYMKNAIKQLNVATTFLPIFFYFVTMVVIGLFMNQIIKTMTPEIGVLMSIGVDKKGIMSLFFMFAFLMSIVAGILGIFLGYGLNVLLTSIMIKTYSMPMLTSSLVPAIAVIAVAVLIVFAELATFISCLAIFRITPKDATISNESKRKPIPKWLSKFIDKAPMNIKLGTNSIAQNLRRFFVSTFSIFASFILILLSTFFFVSKEEMIDQSVRRRLTFDCQIYLTQRDETLADKLETQSFVKDVEDCFYTYVKATSDKNDEGIYLECLAIEPDAGNLVNIPNKKGYGSLKIKEEGIILTKSDASRLGVKVNDTFYINGESVKVTDISYQYFHPINYLSKQQLEKVSDQFVSSILLNVNSDTELLSYLEANENQCLTVFTKSLQKDLTSIFDSINIFIYIMVGFSLGMGFIILSIMSQNALMEQKRQLSIFRAVGFTIFDISNIWTLQSTLQLIISTIFAIPTGIFVAMILFNACSSKSQIYPLIPDIRVILLGFVFIFLVILGCHLISMFTIKKWNLANNTRSRE